MRIGYGKIGRSMPLSLDDCGSLGGDVEMAAVVGELARRHPSDEFWLIGRNTGEDPASVGLPSNVINPWTEWGPELRRRKREAGLNRSNLTIAEHQGVQRLFDGLTLNTITSMDHIILWAGQHGTTNMPIPSVRDASILTKPHDWCAQYCAYLLHAVNQWRDVDPENREEIWLNSDARNRLKLRDLKWPLRHPVLCQYNFTHPIKHERFGDTETVNRFWREQGVTETLYPDKLHGIWQSTVKNAYARLEINGLLPNTPFGSLIKYNDRWENRHHFGLFINETRKYVKSTLTRVVAMRDWVLPLDPHFIHGTWSAESLHELGIDIKPAPWTDYYPKLHSVRSTFTTPASGTGWATAKPWEAFAAGTACFFHPDYDAQNNILGDAPRWLRDYLRVESPEQLRAGVNELNTEPDAWHAVVHAQRQHYEAACADPTYLRHIEKRIYA